MADSCALGAGAVHVDAAVAGRDNGRAAQNARYDWNEEDQMAKGKNSRKETKKPKKDKK